MATVITKTYRINAYNPSLIETKTFQEISCNTTDSKTFVFNRKYFQSQRVEELNQLYFQLEGLTMSQYRLMQGRVLNKAYNS